MYSPLNLGYPIQDEMSIEGPKQKQINRKMNELEREVKNLKVGEKGRKRRRNRNRNRGNIREGLSTMAPVAYSGLSSFRNTNGMKRLQGSELIGSFNGSVNFAIAFDLFMNPGLSASFPLLSISAAMFQQYRFRSLKVRYQSRTSTTSTGSVTISPDYNVRDLPPNNQTSAFNTQNAVNEVTWTSAQCILDPRSMYPFGNRKQIRRSAVSGELNLYDSARVFVTTSGQADTSPIGNLFVDYDVELFIPQNSPNTDTGSMSTSSYTSGTSQTITTGVETIILFPTLNFDPLLIGTPSSGVFTPPAGTYLIRGFIGVGDNTAENFAAYVAIYKNSAANSALNSFAEVSPATGASGLNLSFAEIVTCNGSDTFSVRIYAVGAAGVISTVNAGCTVLISVA